MDKPDPLAQLKDIHIPEPVSWWPLAPGWYVLIALSIITLIMLGSYVYKRYRHTLAKREALVLLQRYQQHYEREGDVPTTSARVSELLKRVALVYFPRAEVASLYGKDWLLFLDRTGKEVNFNSISDTLLVAPFTTDDSINLTPLFREARRWIKQRSVPCSN